MRATGTWRLRRARRGAVSLRPAAQPLLVPDLAFCIAVTGHRAFPEGQRGRLSEAVGQVLADCRAQLVQRATSSALDRTRTISVRCLTALAEGADQLAAEAALTLDPALPAFALDVILPFDRTRYRSLQSQKAGQSALDRLLAKADRVLELADLVPEADPDLTMLRYDTLGRMLVARADLLLAIWDGQAARGTGGTAEVIARAAEHGVPTIWIDPATLAVRSIPGQPQDLPSRTGIAPGSAATLVARAVPGPRLAIEHGLDGALLGSDPAVSQAVSSYAAYANAALVKGIWQWRGRPFGGTGAFAYNLLLWAALLGSGERSWPFRWGRKAGGALGWLPSPLVTPIGPAAVPGADPPPNGSLKGLQDQIDGLATWLGLEYRSGYVAIFSLAGLAVALALAFLFAPTAKPFFVLAELATLLAAGRIYYRLSPSRRDSHRRWLDSRQMAEILRGQHLQAWLGFAGRRRGARPVVVRSGHDRGRDPDGGLVPALSNAFAALSPLPQGVMDTGRISALTTRVASVLAEQAAYHRTNAARLVRFHHRLDKAGIAAIAFSALVSTLYLIVAAIVARSHPADGSGLAMVYHRLSAVAAFFGGVGPALAAALAGVRYHGDFERFAHRSSLTAAKLDRLREQLGPLHLGPAIGEGGDKAAASPAFENLAAIVAAAEDVFAEDLADWRFAYSMRPVPLPG